MEYIRRERQAKTLLRRAIAVSLAALMVVCLVSGKGSNPAYGASTSQTAAANMMAAIGAISADSSGSYNLGQTVTRKQFVKMLVACSPYDEQVTTGVYSAPFRDVSASDWSAPYIRVAVNNGIFSGYSDGTFRPDSPVTLAQAVNSVLLLLGYSQADFQGAFPYAQMNLHNSTGLSQGMNVSLAGASLTRGDAVQLLYNMMGTNVKDGSQKYAVTLGYSVNNSGEIDYASVITDNMYGPYTVKSTASWASELGVNSSAVTVYRNGSLVTTADIAAYDVLYYTADRGTIYAYSNKVTGIYEKATPSQNNLTSIMVSGKTYEVESTAAFSALSSGGTVKIGDAVTLLLGKSGGVADAVLSSEVNTDVVMYITETGEKTYEDGNGNNYTSNYIKGVSTSGNETEYAVSSTWMSEGDVVRINFSGGSIKVNSVSAGTVSGEVNSTKMTIGNSSVAEDVKIIDTYSGSYTATGMSRLNGLSLSSGNVLYSSVENGKIKELILNNVTGDALSYGMVLSASTSGSDLNVSGSYSYDLDGTVYKLNTQNRSLNVSRGAAAIYTSKGETVLRNLTLVSGTVSDKASGYAIIGGKKYIYSPNVKVYVKNGDDYRLGTVDDVVNHTGTPRFYEDFDKSYNSGSRIRVIVID